MKHYQFKTYHQNELETWLDKKTNISEFIRDTLDDVRTGVLATRAELETKEKIETAKLAILESKATRCKDSESLKLRKLEAETEILEQELNYHYTFKNSPSKKARSAIKRGIENRAENTTDYLIKKTGADYIGVCLKCDWFSTELSPTEFSCQHQLDSHLIEKHEKGLFVQ